MLKIGCVFSCIFKVLCFINIIVNFLTNHPCCLCIFLGTFDDGKSFNATYVTKWDMRRRLVYVCKFATNARPSRGNLRQVFNFLIGGKSMEQCQDTERDE